MKQTSDSNIQAPAQKENTGKGKAIMVSKHLKLKIQLPEYRMD